MRRNVVLVLVLWLASLAASGGYLWTHGRLQTDVSSLLPEGASPAQRLLLDQLRSGSTMRLLLLAIEGGVPEELAAASKFVADWMRASNDFAYVANGTDAWSDTEREVLFKHRYVLSSTTTAARFTVDGLHAALQQRLRELASPSGMLAKELLRTDPTGSLMSVIQEWRPAASPDTFNGVWLSHDRKRALLLAETKVPGYAFAPQQALQARLNAAFEGYARQHPGSSLRLLSTGPAAFTVQIQEQIEADAWRLSLLATGIVMAFLYAAYRSLTVLALSLVPLLSAILGGVVVVNLVFGFMHGITLAFGVTLLGVVDDYPIHLFSHMNGQASAHRVMSAIWPTMRTGILTTALGFAAMLFAPFPGLIHLGVFAVSGLAIAALVTRWVLPSLVPPSFAAREPQRRLLPLALRLRKCWPLVPPAVGMAVLGLALAHQSLWEQDVDRLTPIPAAAKALDQRLRLELAAPDVRYLLLTQGTSLQEALEKSERLGQVLDVHVGNGELAGYDAAHRYLPSAKTQERRRAALPDAGELRRRLQGALAGLPFKPGVFDAFVDQVAAARTRPALGLDDYRDTMFGSRVQALLRERQGIWTALLPLHGVADPATLSAKFRSVTPDVGVYLDLKDESNTMVTGFRDGTLRLLGWGGLAILIVLAVSERDWRRVWRITVPMLCAVVCTGAVLHYLGERLSLFHIASFLLVIGLGLDYALFLNHPHRDAEELRQTLSGILVCSATTILVFGVLGSSDVPVLRAIGLTAAIGSVFSLLFASLIAPPAKVLRQQ